MTIVLLMFSPSAYDTSYPVGVYSDDEKAKAAAPRHLLADQRLGPWREDGPGEGFASFWKAEVEEEDPEYASEAYFWLSRMALDAVPAEEAPRASQS